MTSSHNLCVWFNHQSTNLLHNIFVFRNDLPSIWLSAVTRTVNDTFNFISTHWFEVQLCPMRHTTLLNDSPKFWEKATRIYCVRRQFVALIFKRARWGTHREARTDTKPEILRGEQFNAPSGSFSRQFQVQICLAVLPPCSAQRSFLANTCIDQRNWGQCIHILCAPAHWFCPPQQMYKKITRHKQGLHVRWSLCVNKMMMTGLSNYFKLIASLQLYVCEGVLIQVSDQFVDPEHSCVRKIPHWHIRMLFDVNDFL